MGKQLLPRSDRYQHGLGSTVRAEEHRLGVPSVESLGDLAKRGADLTGRHNHVCHGSSIQKLVQISVQNRPTLLSKQAGDHRLSSGEKGHRTMIACLALLART